MKSYGFFITALKLIGKKCNLPFKKINNRSPLDFLIKRILATYPLVQVSQSISNFRR
jgi:hypothetical protein